MRVLLVIPPTGRYIRSDRCQAPVDTRVAEPARAPMDLAYMASILEEMHAACMIKDYPMEYKTWDVLTTDLQNFSPDMLVISTTTPTIENDLLACDLAKKIKPGIKTVAKGAHFLVYDKEILSRFKNLDVIIRGEPEFIVRELASGKDYSQILGITFRDNAEITRNSDAPFIENLDSLPFPARHLLDNRLYLTPDTQEPIAFVTTSRGCPGKCIFCAAGLVSGSKLRMRSVASVISEIEECVAKYYIKNFFFSADTFTWQKNWVLDFCNEILSRGIKIRWGANSRVDTLNEEMALWMKKAGCYVIGFGAESASQHILDKIKKDITPAQIENAVAICKKHDIESYLHFIIGFPWETRETVNETIKFIKKTHASFIEVNIAYPLPGTEFFTIAKSNFLFDENALFGHNHSLPLVKSFSLSTGELAYLRKKILLLFYLRIDHIAYGISKMRSPKIALNYFKYFIRLICNLLKK